MADKLPLVHNPNPTDNLPVTMTDKPSLVDDPNPPDNLVLTTTDKPSLVDDPTAVAKVACWKRGATPRNVSPERRSANIQVDLQRINNIQKFLHKKKPIGSVTTARSNVESATYADDVVESYTDQVTKRLDELVKCGKGSYLAPTRFANVNMIIDSTDKLACGQCVKDVVCQAEDDTMKQFRKFVMNDGKNPITLQLIDKFTTSRNINKARRLTKAEKKTKVHFTEDVVGVSSEMCIQCDEKKEHCFPLSIPVSSKKGRKKCIDRDENKKAALLQFMTGGGPGEIEVMLNMFGLPNSKHYQRTINRSQPLMCQKSLRYQNER